MDRIDYGTRVSRSARALVLLLSLPAGAACSFDVTNPGPVADDALNNAAAMQALVRGGDKTLSFALGWISQVGAVASKEVIGSGSITNHGTTLKERAGILDPEQAEMGRQYGYGQTARFVSEEGVRRIRTVLGTAFSSDARAANALLNAGYANRLMGENMCEAVIDGGPKQPRSVYFERAKAAFTEAITVAGAANKPDFVTAAKAGRAGVNAWLNDWTGVVADATGIAKTFKYVVINSNLVEDQYNYIAYATEGTPFRAVSTYSTWFDQHYTDTKDPRTVWAILPGFPTGDGSTIIFHQQRKFTSRSDPVRLSGGTEMQLLLAEAKLRAGDFAGATTIMNQGRADVGLPAEVTASVTEAWNMLRRERGAELWLEGRAMGDVFRWAAGNVPGTHFQNVAGRAMCIPVGQLEVDTNPNF